MVTNVQVTNVLVNKRWSQTSRSQTSWSQTSGNRENCSKGMLFPQYEFCQRQILGIYSWCVSGHRENPYVIQTNVWNAYFGQSQNSFGILVSIPHFSPVLYNIYFVIVFVSVQNVFKCTYIETEQEELFFEILIFILFPIHKRYFTLGWVKLTIRRKI